MKTWWLLALLAACAGSPTDDACSGAASCDRQTVDEDEVTTGSTATGYRTEIRGSSGTAEIVWTVAGGQTTFQYRPPGGAPGPSITLEGTPADAEGVSRAAILLHRTARADPTLHALYTGPNTLANTAGCDQLHKFDCGPIGKCCDVHDECINANCGGQGGCGNVLLALQAAYSGTPCTDACLRCHGAVVKCFFDGSKPGPSDCCAEGDCGQPQECMIAGKVITDPCECKDAGIAGVHECPDECLTACHLNFAGCLPDGTPSVNPSCCCSCAVRVGTTPICVCQKDCCPDFPGCEPAGTFVNHYSSCCSCMVNGPGLGGACK